MDTMQPMGCLLPLEAGVISRGQPIEITASVLKLLFIFGGGELSTPATVYINLAF